MNVGLLNCSSKHESSAEKSTTGLAIAHPMQYFSIQEDKSD